MVKSFVIDRKKWIRGNPTYSALLVEKDELSTAAEQDGKMCCVGFYAKACGIPKKKLEGKSTIDELDGNYSNSYLERKCGAWTLGDGNKEDINLLYQVNDRPVTTEKVREQKIIALFKKHGVKVKFVN